MSNTVLASTSINATPSDTGTILRELIAAMPLVVFARALRAALSRRSN